MSDEVRASPCDEANGLILKCVPPSDIRALGGAKEEHQSIIASAALCASASEQGKSHMKEEKSSRRSSKYFAPVTLSPISMKSN